MYRAELICMFNNKCDALHFPPPQREENIIPNIGQSNRITINNVLFAQPNIWNKVLFATNGPNTLITN